MVDAIYIYMDYPLGDNHTAPTKYASMALLRGISRAMRSARICVRGSLRTRAGSYVRA